MTQKKTYFVTIATGDIRKESLPQNDIEYEVNATFDEIKEIEMLFTEKDKDAQEAAKYLGKKPFDEFGADSERYDYEDHLVKIYRKLYEVGTEETRNKIKELNLFE